MGLGIVLGNTVPSVGLALQKGKFVGVSLPIGMYTTISPFKVSQSKSLLPSYPPETKQTNPPPTNQQSAS